MARMNVDTSYTGPAEKTRLQERHEMTEVAEPLFTPRFSVALVGAFCGMLVIGLLALPLLG